MKCPNYYFQQTDFLPQAGMLNLLTLGHDVPSTKFTFKLKHTHTHTYTHAHVHTLPYPIPTQKSQDILRVISLISDCIQSYTGDSCSLQVTGQNHLLEAAEYFVKTTGGGQESVFSPNYYLYYFFILGQTVSVSYCLC